MMKLTVHAQIRSDERTKMFLEDIVALIREEAYVSLGISRGYSYLLFYSLPDRECKIAVVGSVNPTLVSVWNKHYRLPREVTRVAPHWEAVAETKFKKFMQARIFGKIREEEDKQLWNAKIRILRPHFPAVDLDCGQILRIRCRSVKNVVTDFKHIFAPIVEKTGEEMGVEYVILLSPVEKPEAVQNFKMKVDELRALLAPPIL